MLGSFKFQFSKFIMSVTVIVNSQLHVSVTSIFTLSDVIFVQVYLLN